MPGLSFQNRLSTWLQAIFRREPAGETASRNALHISALPTLEQILERPDGLPEKYRKLFLPVPLDDEELLIGRDEQFEKLDEALKSWQEGRPTSVALIGPQGSGKTTLVNSFLKRQAMGHKILQREIEKRLWTEPLVLEFFRELFELEDPFVEDVESLIARLLQAPPRLIVLEGAHNLLLRVIGGRKAAEMFFYIVLCTRKRHFWLLTCRRLPWNNMERHLGVSRYFSHVLNIDSLPPDHVLEGLKLRLAKCGLSVVFCRSKEESEKERQPEADEGDEKGDPFFRAVLANSGNNFHAALYFLLLCSRYEESTQSLFLWPPDHLDKGFVKEMDHLHLLTLAELAGHGMLSLKEHEKIFRTNDLHSKTVLEFLEQSRFVEPCIGEHDDGEKTYDLSPVIHHAVTSALEQINLLY